MATSSVPLALAIMAHPQVRDANDGSTALVVFSSDLSRVLWCNVAGAILFGLAAPGPQDLEEAPPSSRMLRQVLASRRMLEASGKATMWLRASGHRLGPLLEASVVSIRDGAYGALALVCAKMPAEARLTEEARAARVLEEAGLGLKALRSKTDGWASEGAEALLERVPPSDVVDEFLAGDEPYRAFDDAGERGVLVRLDAGRLLVWSPGSSPSDVGERETPPADTGLSSGAVEQDDRGRSFPVPVEAGEAPEAVADRSVVAERPGSAAVRFVWRVDSEGVFRSISPEFASAVGEACADVVGRSFDSVAHAFGIDRDGAVAALLAKRDTWSGRTVDWPIEGSSARVPVDLAALPVYSRDRTFDGFRGFGVARVADMVEHDIDQETEAATGDINGEDRATAMVGDRRIAFDAPQRPRTDRPFGRRERVERAPLPEDTGLAPAHKVIRLEERRKPRDAQLSQDEEKAFMVIGEKLGEPGRASGLDDAVREASRVIEESEARRDPARGTAEQADSPPGDEAVADVADTALASELSTVYRGLPLPVLVQHQEGLVYGNREFLDLTGDASIAALNDRGGLASLFVEIEEVRPDCGEITLSRANGEFLAVRTHLQRSTIAGRSCLVMSFYASPSVSAAAIRMKTAAPQPAAAYAATRPSARAANEIASNGLEPTDLAGELEDLRIVLATASSGIVFLDLEGTIKSMNAPAERLFALPTHDIAGRPFLSLFAHESQKAAAEHLERLRRAAAVDPGYDAIHLIGRVAEGGFVPLAVTLARLPGARGWCAVVRDISAARRIEEEMKAAKRQAEAASLQKSQFLANVSHELRTPLNAIIGFADVISSESFGPIGNERYLEYLGDIKRSGHHVLDLVNDLLDISKIEAGKLDLRFDAVSLTEIVGDVVALMQPQANREQVIVRSGLPSSVPPVVADSRSIRQITMNLVSNAIRFTPAGGQIAVSTVYDPDGSVILRFRDSGIGMSEEEIEIAMLPFQQINPSQFRRGEGTGLGLPLTKALVEANRAKFTISSTPGEGTLVEICFPSQRVLAD